MSIISEKCWIDCSQFLIFSVNGRDRAPTLTGHQFVLKSTKSSWGWVSNLLRGGEWGAPSPTATNPNPPPPPSTFETKMATSRQSARSRRSYGKIRDCKQSNYISNILGGSEWWQSDVKEKKGVTRMELKLYAKHEK